MSFILDALKKSELERQRQSVPGLIDVPSGPGRRRMPWWVLAMGALLLVNAVVLSVLLLRGTHAPAATRAARPTASQQRAADNAALNAAGPEAPAGAKAAAAEANPAGESVASAGNDHFSPLDNTGQYAPEIPVPSADADPDVGVRPQSAPPHAARRSDPVLNDTDRDTGNDELLPSINELNLTGQEALPDIHLDVHVYATKPQERFVYINMRKYREGATLQEGPVLERIRRDGVVLNYRGLRFIVPRQ